MNSLDEILSGSSEAVPEQEVKEVETVAAATEGESQTEQQTEGEQEGEGDGQKMVPHQALHAEKQKVKRYTEQVASFEQRLNETNAAWERRMAQLVEAVKPKQEPQPKPDWFENPEEATRATAREYVDPRFDQISQAMMANNQMIAGMKHGDDKVAEADRAFSEAVATRKIDPADYQKVLSSPNVYDAAVKWHQRQLAQAEIGEDPAAYKARVEAELREKIKAELQQGEQPQAKPAAVMPSNLAGARNVGARTGPAWSGPTPIADIFARR